MVSQETSHVFISYAWADGKALARSLATALRKAGVAHFIDTVHRRHEGSLPSELADAVEKSALLCLVLTPATMRSRWVTSEVGLAHEKSIRCIYLGVAGTQPAGDFRLWLGGVPRQQLGAPPSPAELHHAVFFVTQHHRKQLAALENRRVQAERELASQRRQQLDSLQRLKDVVEAVYRPLVGETGSRIAGTYMGPNHELWQGIKSSRSEMLRALPKLQEHVDAILESGTQIPDELRTPIQELRPLLMAVKGDYDQDREDVLLDALSALSTQLTAAIRQRRQ